MKSIFKIPYFSYLPALFWTIFIFFLFTYNWEIEQKEVHIPHLDKIVHFILFFILCSFYILAMNRGEITFLNKYPYFSAISLATLVAILTEGLQKFLSYRSSEIDDVISNGIGIIIAGILFKTRTYFFKKR